MAGRAGETVQLPEEVLVSEFADGAFAELDLFSSMIWPADVAEFRLLVQGSIGVAVAPDDGRDVTTLLKHADTALYEAKEDRARYAFYRPSAEAFASMLTDMPYKICNAILFNLMCVA